MKSLSFQISNFYYKHVHKKLAPGVADFSLHWKWTNGSSTQAYTILFNLMFNIFQRDSCLISFKPPLYYKWRPQKMKNTTAAKSSYGTDYWRFLMT